MIEDNGLLPGIIERLEGTPVRLHYKTVKIGKEMVLPVSATQWSIKKEIGHLNVLEPLWFERVEQLVNNILELSAADMTNAKTYETPHDEKPLLELSEAFFHARMQLVNKLRSLTDEDLEKKSLHPRLKILMHIVDLAYFVAEHDDHHLAQITFLINSDKSWMDQHVL